MEPAHFSHYLKFQKRVIREKRARQVALQQLVEKRKVSEARENQQILSHVLSEHPELTRDGLDLLQIPSGLSETSPLTSERMQSYTDHLQAMIGEAATQADGSMVASDEHAHRQLQECEQRFSENATLRIISDHLCGMCKGGCCTAGGNTAYITVSTIRRYMGQHPELSVDEILEAYLSRLAPETVTSACINQTKAGCVLPREMRSDTCNGYYCDALQEWHERSPEQQRNTVLAVQRHHANWQRFDINSPNRVVDVALVCADGAVPLTIETTGDIPASESAQESPPH